MKRKSGKFIFIPIVATFALLFILFAVVLTTMSDRQSGSFIIGDDDAYDASAGNEYQFVESEDKNGVKYYVITRNTTTSTTEARETAAAEDTLTTVTTTVSSTRKKTTSGTSAASSSDDGVSSETTASTTRTTATQRQLAPGEKIAYLTFDDGPSINTMKILDILDQYNVKATFFVIYHKGMMKQYKAIVDRGHTIALHSYTHDYSKIYKSEKGYYSDLNKIHAYVKKTTGVDSRIIRFPGGSSNTVSNKYNKGIMKTLKSSVTKNGYYYHDWNVSSGDAGGINRKASVLLGNVKKGVGKKKVINVLMHDTGKSKMTTVEALPSIIEYIRKQGYSFEALTEDSVLIQHGR